ncbi:hypothetical protein NKG05_16220 [Oerskovia sp. M15]
MRRDDQYGYLLVHFVEDHEGHGERIYFTLSRGDDPLRWRRLNGGEPCCTRPRAPPGYAIRTSSAVPTADFTSWPPTCGSGVTRVRTGRPSGDEAAAASSCGTRPTW